MSPEKKKVTRKKTATVEVKGSAARAVREFTYAHKNGHDRKDLEALKIYLTDVHDVDISVVGLHSLVEQAKIETKAEAVAAEMESILFSPERPSPSIKLGSAFCPGCDRFKNYRKECPHCGYHQMTV